MARYIESKADVTFKKVFGEHENRRRRTSFLEYALLAALALSLCRGAGA